jgi:hypothetical protein
MAIATDWLFRLPRAARASGNEPGQQARRDSWLRRALAFRPMHYSGIAALLLGVNVALVPVESQANEWQLVGGDDEVATFLDLGSIEREGQTARAWVLRSYSSEIRLGHDLYPHRSQKLEYEFHCADHTFLVQRWVLTDAAYGGGNPVWAGYSRHHDSERTVPGTPEARAADLACSGAPVNIGAAG